MRLFSCVIALVLLMTNGFGQSTTTREAKPFIYSATSEWQKVRIQPNANPSVPSAGLPGPTARYNRTSSSKASTPAFRPAFTGDFATNRNGWKAGDQGDYHYQIGLGRYSIQKQNSRTTQAAFSYVPLPANINLNASDQFTIKIDVLADSGRIPAGGLLFGIRDSLNYNAFTLNSQGEASIIRVINGEKTDDFMAGSFFKPGIAVEPNRNRLTIRRKGYALHVYINEQEIRNSPYRFRMLPGNGIGMTSSAYWTAFQKLSVTLGESGPEPLPSYTSSVTKPVATSTALASDAPATPSSTERTPTVEAPKSAEIGPATFTESFTNNQNHWLTGRKNGYELEMSPGNYYIRKIAPSTVNPAHSYIHLPQTVDLNKAKTFTVTVDMIVPPGTPLDGGLLLGVSNVTTFCQFRLMGTDRVSIKSITNGSTFANYMPGKPIAPKVPVHRERNTLMVKKELNQLHFYINGKEVEDSPHVFRPFKGNGIGFISAASTIKFQKLTVQTGTE